MATLTNQQINLTYPGLIKFEDNGPLTGVAKGLTDGVGNAINMQVLTGQINFNSGIIDFTGATVQGLAAGGLVSGTGPDSMQSAAFLSPNPANASGSGAIAMGNSANATATDNIAIGNFGTASSGSSGIKIGAGNNCTGDGQLSIGSRGTVSGNISVGIGFEANVSGQASVLLSTASQSFGSVTGNGSIGLIPGDFASVIANGGCIVIGSSSSNKIRTSAENCIAIGKSSEATSGNAIAIGVDTASSASNSVALGAGVAASRANTVSMNGLEVKQSALGMILYSPNGTAYRVTVSDAGALEVATA